MPDVLHANDWPEGLAPAYLRWEEASVRTILTIHNIAYQGIFEKERLHRLGIPESAFDMYGVEFHNRLSFLKAGLFYADQVVAVSPSYAREITTKALGAGLHGLMRTLAAEGRLTGILNGIDDSWDPERDPYLPRHFGVQDLSGKQAIADLVRTALCLKPSDGPLFGVVSRLVHQKGLDVVAEVANAIVKEGGQIAILGLGDSETEHLLGRVARGRRDHIALLNGFNEAMARRIVAASHFLLMPSRFEPCGLVQMQAQRYGSLPIAHATGGLADTIEDGKTGFLFSDFSASGLYGACRRAFEAYADKAMLRTMREAAMSRRFDWSAAAEQYEALYCRSLELPRGLRSRPSARCAGCINEGATHSPGKPTTEGAVERHLEKLRATRDAEEHHLVAEAELRMGIGHERCENGDSHVVEGRHRIEKQRAPPSSAPDRVAGDQPGDTASGLNERRERVRL